MPFNKPVLLFDGDCDFCRRWILRWKTLTGNHVIYLPSQEAAKDFLGIPPEEFQKSVQLIEPDGRRCSGAEAVFKTLSYAGSPGWLRIYQKVPGFAPVSEFLYGIIAGHRPIFSAITRWLWGASVEPSSYRLTRWLFLRALAAVYAVAFLSYGVQVRGLNGSQGILPAHDFLNHLAHYGMIRFWYVPTLAWLNSSDAFLMGLCVAGVVAAGLLFLNMAPRFALFCLWLLYLSLVSIGGDFMNFQWDALLLETGFLAIFFAPRGFLPHVRGVSSPRGSILFLLRWLLFRLMVQSAVVKWFSGDLLWRRFIALTVHYQTQPLPNPISWFVHQWPVGFHKMSCVVMFIIEGFVPVLIFAPRRARIFAFWVLAGFQGLILLTGNYAYFNWLAVALCLVLLDDQALRAWMPSWSEEPILPSQRRVPLFLMVGAFLFLTSVPFVRMLGIPLPASVLAPVAMVSSLRSFNSYGLFAVMTPDRPEIILEGSGDGKTWVPYEFKYKPGDLSHGPRQVAPHQPRLDWQMWFAALGDYRQNPWFIYFCIRILQGSQPVLGLLAANPFPETPPVYLRATVYEYRFTTPSERSRTGQWWARDVKGPYCPVISLKKR